MPKCPELVIAGNLLTDYLVFPDGRCAMGEPGGAVLHTALGARLWGVPVAILSVVGREYPLELLEERGVDVSGVRRLSGRGLRVWLLYEPSGRQLIPWQGGPTHLEVSPHPGDRAKVAGLVHLAPMPWERQVQFIDALPSGRCTIDLCQRLEELSFEQIAPRLAGLFLGQDETSRDTPPPGPGFVAMKRGASGGSFHQGGLSLQWEPHPRVLEPTGAGDAFAGGVLAGLLLGDDPARAVARGWISAQFALSDLGARGLLAARPEDAQRAMEANPSTSMIMK